MRFPFTRAAAALFLSAMTLAGCGFTPTHTEEDVARVADDVLDFTEVALPKVAEGLNGQLAFAYISASGSGGNVGNVPIVVVTMWGEIDGSNVDQPTLERALLEAGFNSVAPIPEKDPKFYPESGKFAGATASSIDGSVTLRIFYSEITRATPGYSFELTSTVQMRLSGSALSDFKRNYSREFDPKLLSRPAPFDQ